MQYITTTATAVENLKIRAKAIQQDNSLSRHAALEVAACEAGYESWFHVCWCLKQPAPPPEEASVAIATLSDQRADLDKKAQDYIAYLTRQAQGAHIERFPVRGDVFHAVEIDGHFFYGAVGIDGPAVVHKSARLRGYDRGWVQLGVAEINRSTDDYPQYGRDKGGLRQWVVCKYGPMEPRIWINELSSAARFALACEFGIPVIHFGVDPAEPLPPDAQHCPFTEGGMFLFGASQAFQSLVEVARKHPRKARGWCANSYLGYWGAEARLAAGCPRPDDDLLWRGNARPRTL